MMREAGWIELLDEEKSKKRTGGGADRLTAAC